MKGRFRSGQAMLEYMLAFAGLLVVVGLLVGLVKVAKRYSVRTENIVTSDSP